LRLLGRDGSFDDRLKFACHVTSRAA